MFSHVRSGVWNPYRNALEAYVLDHRPEKVGLNVNTYLDSEGNVPILHSVRKAMERIASSYSPSAYLPVEGDQAFRIQVGGLLFGSQFESLRDSLAIVQTVGGTGALRSGAEFLKSHFPHGTISVSAPTWPAHVEIFEAVGFVTREYRYLDAHKIALDFRGMVADLRRLKPHDVVLLQPCCHNPTGVDPDERQWHRILDLIAERSLIPFVDSAYQGLADGLDSDAFLMRELARRRLSFIAATSLSKTFSLYGERCGALVAYCADSGQTANVLGQLGAVVRRQYSSPPAQGSRLVATILADPALSSQWHRELEGMRMRLIQLRRDLHAALVNELPDRSFEHVLSQRGLFAVTGLTPQEICALQTDFGVYVDESGRLCVAGLNPGNIGYVAHAIGKVSR
jgi:aromatic-amino-acid transaminase